ncbi:MAG: DNA repair protein RecN [Chloroflexota bacterium]|jgi:DNA repair protein RecN (Recombination protein N)
MLTELRIQNFAIIQSLELTFKPGLTTFTGETGAGKSIILDAIVALLGGRADVSLIRAGAERASVEAVFTIPAANREAILALLESEDLADDPDQILIAREVRQNGRSGARVNGHSVPLNLLRDLGSYLIDIHGQSEHLSLLNVRQHLHLLDRFVAAPAALEEYRSVYRQLRQTQKELETLRQSEQDAARRSDLLEYQALEIEDAHLHSDEEDGLRQERNRLANAEHLSTLAQEALNLLDDGLPDSPALTDLLAQIIQALEGLARIDPSKQSLTEQALVVNDTLADITRDLRLYLETIEFNPRRLEQVEERLDLIQRLKRKYGGSIEAVLAFARSARQELDGIAHATERIAELQAREAELSRSLAALAQRLTGLRRAAAERISRAVEAELNDLSMAGAQFDVQISAAPHPDGLIMVEGSQPVAFDENGVDQIEFFIAPNPGEGLKPLVKIASGGETSRLMLALKRVLTQADSIPTLIFDEIDQGIGGRVGSVVGEKLWLLARNHQVLCVTHLPQLAAFGDQHLSVRKEVDEGRTSTRVDDLRDEARLIELAQMIGAVTQINLNAARETLATAQARALHLAGRLA